MSESSQAIRLMTGLPHQGEYCVFRGSRTGVYAGFLDGAYTVGRTSYFLVRESRRLQYQKYVGEITLCSVATRGLDPASRLSPSIPLHSLQAQDVAEIFPCTAEAAKNIRELPATPIDPPTPRLPAKEEPAALPAKPAQ